MKETPVLAIGLTSEMGSFTAEKISWLPAGPVFSDVKYRNRLRVALWPFREDLFRRLLEVQIPV
jgi:hypothetical protein